MTDPATRLTLKVVHPLVHLDRLPNSRPLLPSEEVAELLEVVLVLVKFIVRHGAFGPVSDLFRFIAIGRRDGRDPELVRNSVPDEGLVLAIGCRLLAGNDGHGHGHGHGHGARCERERGGSYLAFNKASHVHFVYLVAKYFPRTFTVAICKCGSSKLRRAARSARHMHAFVSGSLIFILGLGFHIFETSLCACALQKATTTTLVVLASMHTLESS